MNRISLVKLALCSMICIILGVFLTVDASVASNAIKSSVDICLEVIIPSLFAFMVLASFMLSSGIFSRLFIPLYYVSKFWFKGDIQLFSVFMASLFGGYPIGVKLISELNAYNNSYTAIGSKYLSFCYCPSPTFVIGIIGLGMFADIKIGLIVYISNVIACFTVAIAVNLFTKRRNEIKLELPLEISLKTLSKALSSTVKSLSIICSSIIMFNILNAFLEIFLKENSVNFIKSIIEISNVTKLPADFSLLPFYAALFSTGGLCIIFQTFVLAESGIKITAFLIARIPCALLSALYCYLLLVVSDVSVKTSVTEKTVGTFSVNPICSICLIIMCYILLKSQKKITKNSRNIK